MSDDKVTNSEILAAISDVWRNTSKEDKAGIIRLGRVVLRNIERMIDHDDSLAVVRCSMDRAVGDPSPPAPPLPYAKTCGGCRNYKRCAWAHGIGLDRKTCVYLPHRFIEAYL